MKPDGGTSSRKPRRTSRFIRAQTLEETVISDAAHAAETGALAASTRSSALAAMLAGHVLRDGETVLLALKPSLWFIVFQSALFTALVALLLLGTWGFGQRLAIMHRVMFAEAAAFFVACRVMWSVLQWMGRLYVLTDQRVIRITGIFAVEVYECPLRKVGSTHVIANLKDRICRVGSIEIRPRETHSAGDTSILAGSWQTVPRPAEVHEQIATAVRKAQNGNSAC